MIEADYSDFADDMKSASVAGLIERTTLIAHVEQFFHKKQIEADWDAIGKANDETLVTALFMASRFNPLEKRALFEAGGFLECTNILTLRPSLHFRREFSSPHPRPC
ncbi:MAG: hypothetical protein OXU19_14970 [bacterium]|nr:hypothetical protein [bacterium]